MRISTVTIVTIIFLPTELKIGEVFPQQRIGFNNNNSAIGKFFVIVGKQRRKTT